MPVSKKQPKRILSVTIKRMYDESPDTSWLGEYASSSTSNYSIDRKHSLDCITQVFNTPTGEGLRLLESANDYVNSLYNDLQTTELTDADKEDRLIALDDADTILCDLRNGNAECDCGESGDMSRNEYRYFTPSNNYDDDTPENRRKYAIEDYQRMEALNNGQWCFIGIRAEARVQLTGETWQEITSGGLWGIESDSDESYFEEVGQDELSDLRKELRAIGFSQRAISSAFKNVERKDA